METPVLFLVGRGVHIHQIGQTAAALFCQKGDALLHAALFVDQDAVSVGQVHGPVDDDHRDVGQMLFHALQHGLGAEHGADEDRALHPALF